MNHTQVFEAAHAVVPLTPLPDNGWQGRQRHGVHITRWSYTAFDGLLRVSWEEHFRGHVPSVVLATSPGVPCRHYFGSGALADEPRGGRVRALGRLRRELYHWAGTAGRVLDAPAGGGPRVQIWLARPGYYHGQDAFRAALVHADTLDFGDPDAVARPHVQAALRAAWWGDAAALAAVHDFLAGAD